METEQIIQEARRLIKGELDEKHQAFLFGSWAKGTATSKSDVDIAIDGEQSLSDEQLSALRRLLETIPTLRKIDLIDLRRVDAEFRQDVLEHAKPL